MGSQTFVTVDGKPWVPRGWERKPKTKREALTPKFKGFQVRGFTPEHVASARSTCEGEIGRAIRTGAVPPPEFDEESFIRTSTPPIIRKYGTLAGAIACAELLTKAGALRVYVDEPTRDDRLRAEAAE